ncbi:MAG: glycosyltransferase [Verrucomicrobia bacterium]|nr:glycosyltransferase [Verrucomicrobiota bacterium]
MSCFRVSVIIPALNEEASIGRTVRSARSAEDIEVIVVDGGSTDSTANEARSAGAVVVESGKGRARQMNAGAQRATGETLVFLHADTVLTEGWRGEVDTVLSTPGVSGGAFQFKLADSFAGSRFLEWGVRVRSGAFSRPYGDQALFLRKRLFCELGGYADLPIMEDYEFCRRLRRSGRLVMARASAITSGRRWQRLGVLRTTLINSVVIIGFHLGFSPARLAELYRNAK